MSRTPSEDKKSPGFLGSPPFSGLFRKSPRTRNHTLDGPDEQRRQQQHPQSAAESMPTLLNFSPPPPLKRATKTFPRSMSLASGSEVSTLLNPVSPPFLTHKLDGEPYDDMDKGEGSSSKREGSSESSGSLDSVQIAAITVLLSKPTKRAVGLKLFVKEKEFLGLDYRYEHIKGDPATPLLWSLQPYLTLRRGTSFDIHVRQRRVWPRDPLLAKSSLNVNDAIDALQALGSQDDATIHQYILREDPTVVVDLVPDLQANLNMASEISRKIKSVIKSLGGSREFLEKLMAYGSAISEILLEQDKCNRVVVDLADRMARTLSFILDVQQFARLAQLKRALEDVRPLMQDTTNFILKYANRTMKEKAIDTAAFRDDIDSLKKKFDIFEEQFDRGLELQAGMTVEEILGHLLSTKDDQILQELRPKGLEVTRPVSGCLEGTRTEALRWIDEWTDDFNAHNILWVNGFPGVGKSSIAASVITNLRTRNRLGSRFIFEREKATASTPNVLWRNVAYDLAQRYPSIRRAIVERLKDEDVDVETSNVKSLFHELIQEPLLAVEREAQENGSRPIPKGRLPVVVIDALDECGGRDGQRSGHRTSLLGTLKRWSRLPKHYKLIVTSRSEADIKKALTGISDPLPLSAGAEVDDNASADINLFLRKMFAKIAKAYLGTLPPNWPGPEVCDELTRRAAGLFLWATTAIAFINMGDPVQQLDLLLHGVGLGDVGFLYAKVLDVSFKDPTADVLQDFQKIVGAVVFAKRPLTTQECATLLPLSSPTMLDFVRKGLQSVLGSNASNALPDVLRFSHQSFVEFLLSSRCSTPFRIDETTSHKNLAKSSLRIMDQQLRFNIAQFPDSHIKNAALVDLDYRAETLIGSPLIYAARFWMDHVQMCPWDEDIFQKVKVVILDKLLFWFEVLSVVGEIYGASATLRSLLKWCRDDADDEFIEFVEDALKFLDAFNTVMSQSLPHIYISALPFAPKSSKVAQHFRAQFPRLVCVEDGKFAEWPRVVFTVDEHEHEASINCAVFSPNDQSKFIASGSNDKTVRVWDAETGDLVSGPMDEHTDYVGTVAFSPDGKQIASGSDDGTIRIWDTESGEEVQVGGGGGLRHHKGVVTCVVFSNSGLFLASAGYDGLIVIWDMDSGSEGYGNVVTVFGDHGGAVTSIAYSPDDSLLASGSVDRSVWVRDALADGESLEPFGDHTNQVNCVVFSPDGKRVASASEDETILIWDLEETADREQPFRLEGHTDGVTSIAFSPDGTRLVSGSHDGILILWDISTGNIVCEPFTGHRGGVTSVAFSPSGHRILSSSCDKQLLIWDADCTDEEPYTLTPFLDIPAHQDNVKSVAFSPDGLRIVSGSDDETIRLWDAETGEPINDVRFHREDLAGHHEHRFPQPPSHLQGVDVVAYSPDGAFIASGSGSSDGEVCVWDSATGALLQPVLRGHVGGIISIAFLSDSKHLVSSSYDKTTRVWDVESGETIVGPLTPYPEGWITSAAVSPDGTKIASATNDFAIRIFDAESGEQVGEALEARKEVINCLTFTPDSQWLVSGSYDKASQLIRVWNMETREMKWDLEKAHEKHILCLAISPDGRFVASGSADETIMIWDLETKEPVLGPLEGHTSTIFAVAFNHDGTRLVSSSEDETIRVWDVSSMNDIRGCFVGARPAEFSDNAGYQQGWIVKSRRQESESLLLWVPPWCRSGVWWPRNTAVVSEVSVQLDLRTFVHGESWADCYESGVGH
ncbi:hypothetical protein DFP72DRAFT_817605 [Ephemerocybe angulata]|uniref:Nephrocystin 3-like N-terminal domain-containing protein n=1 Tax=Ephemerocybe angulata TaxID=980116 RepID=A0A8H6HQK8_9AGAR|nr:hypothetical protein DFP72DRAFT_817605 [Tulosesus angulatus]